LDTSVTESYENLPIMHFVDKTERSVTVSSVDSNNTFWVLFVHDSINVIIIIPILIFNIVFWFNRNNFYRTIITLYLN